MKIEIIMETGAQCIAIDEKRIAGEIFQKHTDYHVKMAAWGDFSHYTSKPPHGFIDEANHGGDFFFVGTKEEAVKRLDQAR